MSHLGRCQVAAQGFFLSNIFKHITGRINHVLWVKLSALREVSLIVSLFLFFSWYVLIILPAMIARMRVTSTLQSLEECACCEYCHRLSHLASLHSLPSFTGIWSPSSWKPTSHRSWSRIKILRTIISSSSSIRCCEPWSPQTTWTVVITFRQDFRD